MFSNHRSGEYGLEPGPSSAAKKPKLDRTRACDGCRRRKQRCDGPQQADLVCSSCRQGDRRCTYVEASKPRGPPKAYVTGLEDRVERMERLLRRLRPDIDLNAELGGPSIPRGSWKTEEHYSPPPPAPRHVPSVASLRSLRHAPGPGEQDGAAPERSSDEEDPYEAELERTVDAFDKRLRLTELEVDEKSNKLLDRTYRYHGASAPILMASAAAEHRLFNLAEGGADPASAEQPAREARFVWESIHRKEFMTAPAWEIEYEGLHITSPRTFPDLQNHWPPPDLASALVDLYFYHFNSMFPLLHRPTFDAHFADKLYERDIWFACVCMGVFAIASKHSDDTRVLFASASSPSEASTDEDDVDTTWHSAGVRYYYAVMTVLARKQSMLTPASLFEVQAICLSTHFQRATRWAGGAWVMYAASIRKVQDVGAHRKRSYKHGVTVENELWKRAYWWLVGFDRTGSAALGRPCSTRPEDADAELPLPVDDEYWEADFQQPSDGPLPQVTAFILWLRLTEITSFVLMHYYVAVDSPERHAARPADELLKQLNAAMAEWIESVPDHLKWSPDIPDPVTANQSATLFLNYNMLTILIQRAFLPPTAARLRSLASPTHPGVRGYPQAATALAVAVSAARAGARVLEAAHARNLSNMPIFLHAAEVFGATLCVDAWLLKLRERARGAPALDAMHAIETRMREIQAVLRGVERARARWEIAGPTLAALRAAVPAPEDEGAWAGLELEVMPDGEDDEGEAEVELDGDEGAGAGASGAAHAFFLEHDAAQSRASAAASAAPAAPAFPHSPTYAMPQRVPHRAHHGYAPYGAAPPHPPPHQQQHAQYEMDYGAAYPPIPRVPSTPQMAPPAHLHPHPHAHPQAPPAPRRSLAPVKLEDGADYAPHARAFQPMPPPPAPPAGWAPQPWPAVQGPYAAPLAVPLLRSRYNSWDAGQQQVPLQMQVPLAPMPPPMGPRDAYYAAPRQ